METKTRPNTTETRSSTDLPPVAQEYNGVDRNAFLFGWTPQAELWNGRLAMIGFLAYLLWDAAGYSVLRNVLHLLPQYVVR
ncbi:high light inducible protein [Leptolyngbya sp. FACHB-541]|uniref:chlorophyll a/b-binding protein n=1 Tax=Leptolyngbya sp. FACHB-541 TaxID=2692810 RepID=UPI0016846560|nr:chlorophyll a/b-binding protein [Leptolyngbya sp. FACHB-541]MBD1996123.1 high light inducible protein [Leptolyngbya sp. FACHB-541]